MCINAFQIAYTVHASLCNLRTIRVRDDAYMAPLYRSLHDYWSSLNSRDLLSRQLAPASTINIVDGRIDMSDFRLRSTRPRRGRDYGVRVSNFSKSVLYSSESSV